MGYYTSYKLTVLNANMDEIDSSVHPEWDEDSLYGDGLSIQSLITNNAEAMKWYNHEDEMRERSKQYPEYVFILDGDGEEAGDVWREFYKDGKTYSWTAEIKRPDFDVSKLK